MRKSLAECVHEKLGGEREIIVGRAGKLYCGNCGYLIEDEGSSIDIIHIRTNDGVPRSLCLGCRYDLFTGRNCSELEQGKDYEVGW